MKKFWTILCAFALILACPAFAEDAASDVVTLKVFYSAPNEYESWSWGADPVSRWVTEQTGIALDITFASTADHQEFYTLLASDMISEYDMLYLGRYEPTLVDEGYVFGSDGSSG